MVGLSIFALLLLQAPAFAGEEVGEGEWAPLSAGPFTTWTASLVGKGKLAVQPSAIYSHTRGEFNDDGHYQALSDFKKKSQFQEQISVQYGITDKWEIDAQTAYLENYASRDEVKASDRGLGDSYLITRYELLEEKGWMPEATGLVQVKMPTGKFQHEDEDKLETDMMGTGSWDPGIGIALTKTLKPFLVHADVVANFPQKVRVDGTKTQYADYFNYDAAVEYFLPKGFNLMCEVNGFYQGERKEDGGRVPASDVGSLVFAPGIGWSNKSIQTLIAYQRTVLGTNVDANDAVVATFIYTF
jgi:hypothetical protein